MLQLVYSGIKKVYKNKKNFWLRRRGFTLLELLLVVAIVGILSTFVLINFRLARETANVNSAGAQQILLSASVESYFADMGFFPPDVNRGWDPGFVQSFPWNPDQGYGIPLGGSSSPGTNCDHCPPNWQDIIVANWNGPYLERWPRFTPWNGKFDYNYWDNGQTRYGCLVSPGIYIGVQGDYNNNNIIPNLAEEKMIRNGFDADDCINGESQLLLWDL